LLRYVVWLLFPTTLLFALCCYVYIYVLRCYVVVGCYVYVYVAFCLIYGSLRYVWYVCLFVALFVVAYVTFTLYVVTLRLRCLRFVYVTLVYGYVLRLFTRYVSFTFTFVRLRYVGCYVRCTALRSTLLRLFCFGRWFIVVDCCYTFTLPV